MISTHSYPWDLAANTGVCGIPGHAETTAAIVAEHVRERGHRRGHQREHCLKEHQGGALSGWKTICHIAAQATWRTYCTVLHDFGVPMDIKPLARESSGTSAIGRVVVVVSSSSFVAWLAHADASADRSCTRLGVAEEDSSGRSSIHNIGTDMDSMGGVSLAFCS